MDPSLFWLIKFLVLVFQFSPRAWHVDASEPGESKVWHSNCCSLWGGCGQTRQLIMKQKLRSWNCLTESITMNLAWSQNQILYFILLLALDEIKLSLRSERRCSLSDIASLVTKAWFQCRKLFLSVEKKKIILKGDFIMRIRWMNLFVLFIWSYIIVTTEEMLKWAITLYKVWQRYTVPIPLTSDKGEIELLTLLIWGKQERVSNLRSKWRGELLQNLMRTIQLWPSFTGDLVWVLKFSSHSYAANALID